MNSCADIRDKAHLSGDEVLSLNFIQGCGSYVFRKYYRFGLRSHIFEVLLKADVLKEASGVIKDGIRIFPRAKPQKMLRILRHHFEDLPMIFNEIQKYYVLMDALGSDLIATSEEFIVDYTGTGTSQMILCGLQEYVPGEILDPWRITGPEYLEHIFKSLEPDIVSCSKRAETAKENIRIFVKKIRQMIFEKGFIPDLAGIGNLILTPDGGLKLVDINNIVKIRFVDDIPIDDKGYPSCDVSIDVLSILESRLLNREILKTDPIFRHFLSSERKKKVKVLERKFYKNLQK